MKSQDKKKVFVAMSGGVDSSFAAVLLKKQGFDVTGVFMRPWSPVDKRHRKSFIHSDIRCLWQKDREDAMKVAVKLSIPLLTWDFSKEYKKEVADYMIKEYKAGRTPNPDVMCNKHIKFGLFLKKAIQKGADYIATGHYVRIIRDMGDVRNVQDNRNEYFKHSEAALDAAKRSSKQSDQTFKLFIARDKNKDQSYFLWTLTQEQLKYCLFPIGDYIKPEVRQKAKKFGLSIHSKKDSQGICFVSPLDINGFLKRYIKSKRGKILDLKENWIGDHDGIFYYTIGQRHGLDIKNGKGPYFVIRKNIKSNVIYVGSKNDLNSSSLKTEKLNWINKINFPVELDVRIRYRAKLSKAIIKTGGEVVFKKPEIAVTSGQSIVFYKNRELLGGGIIV